MNKTKKILAAIGGVIGLAVLAMGYFAWDSYSQMTVALEGDEEEGTEGLEGVVARAEQLSGKKPFPCMASVKAIESNTASVVAWKAEALALAARGDRSPRVTTPTQFKSEIVEEAKQLAALAGTVNGKLVQPEFGFGSFKPYVAEGKMPEASELPQLTRQWDDVAGVIKTLAASGIAELQDVQTKAVEAEQKDDASKKRNNSRGRAKQKPKADDESLVRNAYEFTFTTRAPGLVKSINALTTGERFIVINSLKFVRERDPIAEALGGGEQKGKGRGAAAPVGGRRRRGQVAAVQAKEKEEPKNGIITDPLLDAPMKVTLNLTVYDFRTREGEKSEEKGEKK